jgi:hypothetical protein
MSSIYIYFELKQFYLNTLGSYRLVKSIKKKKLLNIH